MIMKFRLYSALRETPFEKGRSAGPEPDTLTVKSFSLSGFSGAQHFLAGVAGTCRSAPAASSGVSASVPAAGISVSAPPEDISL